MKLKINFCNLFHSNIFWSKIFSNWELRLLEVQQGWALQFKKWCKLSFINGTFINILYIIEYSVYFFNVLVVNHPLWGFWGTFEILNDTGFNVLPQRSRKF